MRNYTFGRALEYQIQAELEGYGYRTMRSSGSKGMIDVAAWRKGETLFIQAKRRGFRDFSPKEWNELYRFATENNAIALLALKKDEGIGNRYWRLAGEKVSRSRHRPIEVWIPSEPGQGKMFE